MKAIGHENEGNKAQKQEQQDKNNKAQHENKKA